MSNTDNILTVKPVQRSRIDAALKVTGQASYTSDFHFDRLVFAVPVGSTIAKGKVKSVDETAARKIPGVLEILTHKNIGTLYYPTPDDGFKSRTDEARPPFDDDVVRYYGQYVACVVGETLEIAEAGARAIRVTYETEKPNVDMNLKQEDLVKVESQRGEAEDAFKKAAVKIDQVYMTPTEVHNPIEMHATVAQWAQDSEGADMVTLHETTQALFPHRNVLAEVLGLPVEKVRVISKFLGSGFGGKLWPWPHSVLAAAASRKLKRPVKLVIERRMMFTNVGHRPHTQQNVKLGADKNGKLQSLEHIYSTQGNILGDYKEACGEASSSLYSVPNLLVRSGVARRNIATPTSMRGPGAVPGLFALESAMDELAVALKMDPIQLRLLNDTLVDESTGHPFSSRHLKECLELGAKKFGWSKRNAQVGSMKDGNEILGWGVSACTWQAKRLDADAQVNFLPTGKIQVKCATQDIGTGTYTVLAEVASEELKIPREHFEVILGDTQLPVGPISGGSMATGSLIPAVLKASRDAVKSLKTAAVKAPKSPFFREDPSELKFEAGKLSSPKNKTGIEFSKLMQTLNLNSVSGSGSEKGSSGPKDSKVTMKSFGAQFVEIGWHPGMARLRVRRVVTVIDGGRIINYQPALNQIEGAIIMGIGMGLFEEAEYDTRYGNPVNANLADYMMTVHADSPEMDVTFLDYPDKELNELGARGIGEIGLAGVASSITSAVYHATGVRVRELPVKIEDLLKS